MHRLMALVAVITLISGTPHAHAERKTIDRVVTTAIADGKHLEAIANLERMRSSRTISSSDPFVINGLKQAWAGYLDVDNVSATVDLAALAKLERAARVASKYNVPDADRYAKLRDDMVVSLTKGRDKASDFAHVTAVAETARSSSLAQKALAEAMNGLGKEVAKLELPGAYGNYIKVKLLHYYGLLGAPEHPADHPISLEIESLSSGCQAAITAIRQRLSLGTGKQGKLQLKIEECSTGSTDANEQRDFKYEVATERKEFVVRRVQVPIYGTKPSCTGTSSFTPSSGTKGTYDYEPAYTTQSTTCTPVPSDEVIGHEEQDVGRYETVKHVETLTEKVLVTTRTSTTRLRGSFAIAIGDISHQGSLDSSKVATSERYIASKAGKKSEFRNTDAESIIAATEAGASEIGHQAKIVSLKSRVNEIYSQLPAAAGQQRIKLLAELSADEFRGHRELIEFIAANCSIASADIELALAGKRWQHLQVISASDVVDMPYPDSAAVAGLVEDEDLRELRGKTASAVTGMLGAVVGHADGQKYGVGLLIRSAWTSGKLAYRDVVPYILYEGSVDYSRGGEAAGGYAVGYRNYVGVGAFAGTHEFNVGAFALGGHDGLWVKNHDNITVANSLYVPGAFGLGYGAETNLSKHLRLRATRVHRRDDEFPSRWSAELVVGGNKKSFGVWGAIYDPLLNRDGGEYGPWQIMFGFAGQAPLFGKGKR